MVGVYHAEQAGMGDDPDGRWVTVCETHHTLVSHPTLALARYSVYACVGIADALSVADRPHRHLHPPL